MALFESLAAALRDWLGSGTTPRTPPARDPGGSVGGIVDRCRELSASIASRRRDLDPILARIPVAIDAGEDEVALDLIRRKDELASQIESMIAELREVGDRAEEAKTELLSLRGEGPQVDAAVEALDGVRDRVRALDDPRAPNPGESLDAKLQRIQAKAASSSARAQLEAMRRRTPPDRGGGTSGAPAFP